jgi:hypoxanthine phosphoribosyltransferase
MGPTSMSPDELGEISSKNFDPKKTYYNWNTYYRLVITLKNKIQNKPDIIISIGKGGSIPGVILAEHFDVNNLNIGLKSYSNFNQSKMIEYQSIPSYEALRGANILLVDDLSDTGETFKYALDKFKEKGVNDVKTASVFKKSKSSFVPDYYVEEISSDVWIVQPWEFVEPS